ncbi:hypothetical protein Gorai_024798 [Gossypium raimondii]|uniref:Uncharacterized protein n=1 Tax=Gossypium raimondii TaxID=29730 RepID=A0A7J8P0E7_GOSRA|nr:hypothetical protein [Gossypium raimondii]
MQKKVVFRIYEKEAEKGQKKYKKSKDAFGEVREISMNACLGGKESMGQESNEVTFLESNFGYKAKRMRNKKSLKGSSSMVAEGTWAYLAWMLAPWKMWTSTILLRIGLEIHVKNIGTGWAISMARIGTSLLLNKLKFLLIDISHTCLMQRSPIVAMPSWSAIAAVLFLSSGNGFLITN